MNTYSEVKAKLISIGFRDVSENYGGGACAEIIRLGYGTGADSVWQKLWPSNQIRVFRRQVRVASGYAFEDVIQATGESEIVLRDLADLWLAGVRLMERTMKIKVL